MKSIKLKLVIIYLALVFMVMIVSGTFMLINIKLHETDKAKINLKNYSRMIDDQIIKKYERQDFQTGFELTPLLVTSTPIEGNILNPLGQVIASNTSTSITYINPTIIAAISGTESFGSGKALDVHGDIKNWINYSVPIKNLNNEIEYIIFTRVDQEQLLDTLTQFSTTFFFTSILALVMTALLGYLFANTLTGPIISLTKKVKEIAQGNLSQEIPVNNSDEIGQLTESFNNMAKDLNTTIGNMISEKNKLETLLHNMTDGVLAYDSSESIIHANIYFYELLDLDLDDNISFSQMMSILEVDAKNIQELSTKKIMDKYIAVKDKYIGINFATYLNNNSKIEGLLIVLQDITKHKKLDNMRKEFVANVSHEIRTPLTNIKSYTETLIDGAINDKSLADNFLSVINNETDRMTLLVKDLLELSSFDSEQLTFNMEKIDLKYIIHQCVEQNKIVASKKNQIITFEESDLQYFIMADPARINQVITNIISNAIKYSKENGKIEISITGSTKYYTILIKDSGIGIPKDDLNRIFERFYRVDKARSREMGGTGLGLAISKEIMDMHNGKIYATSEIGKGTTMILKFLKLNE